MNEPVVVGFDDTEHSAGAVECAVQEAIARKVPLRLVHAYNWIPAPVAPGVPLSTSPVEGVREAVTSLLGEAAQKVRDAHPDLVVEAVPVLGDPSRMLTEAGHGASLLVVGGRGRGGFAGMLLGSVALRVLTMAGCPVMVVRGGQDAKAGRITVGVDLLSSQQSTDVLEFAFAEARLRGADLSVLNVWENPYHRLGSSAHLSHDAFAAFENLQRDILARILEPLLQEYADVVVTQQALPGVPTQMLVDSTLLSDVLVVGGDAREKHPGMRIGALAHIVLHYAGCPVVVVPEH